MYHGYQQPAPTESIGDSNVHQMTHQKKTNRKTEIFTAYRAQHLYKQVLGILGPSRNKGVEATTQLLPPPGAV